MKERRTWEEPENAHEENLKENWNRTMEKWNEENQENWNVASKFIDSEQDEVIALIIVAIKHDEVQDYWRTWKLGVTDAKILKIDQTEVDVERTHELWKIDNEFGVMQMRWTAANEWKTERMKQYTTGKLGIEHWKNAAKTSASTFVDVEHGVTQYRSPAHWLRTWWIRRAWTAPWGCPQT